MQAVILAAGRGTRMGSLTEETPKPLLLVKGKSLLEYKFDTLPESISEVVIIVGYLDHKIKDRVGEQYAGRRITYVEQKELNGTMGALLAAQSVLKDAFIVLMGDDIYDREDIARVADMEIGLCAKEVRDREYGGELLLDESGHFIGMHEKRHWVDRGLINTGLYKLDMAFLEEKPVLVNGGSELGIPQTLAQHARHRAVRVDVTEHPWRQISNKDDLEAFERSLEKE